jgi:hypothetical protein
MEVETEPQRLRSLDLASLWREYKRTRIYRNLTAIAGIVSLAVSPIFPIAFIGSILIFATAAGQHAHMRTMRPVLAEKWVEFAKMRASL